MKKVVITVFLVAIAGLAVADDRLDGAFERVSLSNVRTGESPEAANRKGAFADGAWALFDDDNEPRAALHQR